MARYLSHVRRLPHMVQPRCKPIEQAFNSQDMHLLPRRFLRAVYLAVLRLYEHRLPVPRLYRLARVGNVCPAFPCYVWADPCPLPPHLPHSDVALLRIGNEEL